MAFVSKNVKRARRARDTLEHYKQILLGETGPLEESDLVDLLTDLRQWAYSTNGVEWFAALMQSSVNFEQER